MGSNQKCLMQGDLPTFAPTQCRPAVQLAGQARRIGRYVEQVRLFFIGSDQTHDDQYSDLDHQEGTRCRGDEKQIT